MPRALRHHPEDLLKKIEGHLFMKEITHGVNKDAARFAPALWIFETLALQGKVKAIGEVLVEALGDSLSVAVLAPWADFVAARGWVPRLICPLYSCVSAGHSRLP